PMPLSQSSPAGSDFDPQAALAILLGASDYQFEPQFSSPTFAASAARFREYLVGPAGLGLPPDRVEWLFGQEGNGQEIAQKGRHSWSSRLGAGQPIRDLLVYYVGHGDLSTDGAAYYLFLRDSRKAEADLTALSVRQLKESLGGEAAPFRLYLILD